ncbi:MAG: hypothetical protein AAFU54_27155 [Chloroflexota bacterium]
MTEQKRQKVHKPDDVTFEQTENGIRIRWRWRSSQIPLIFLVLVAFTCLVGVGYNIQFWMEYGELAGGVLTIPLFISIALLLYLIAITWLNETVVQINNEQILISTQPFVEFWKNHQIRSDRVKLVFIEKYENRRPLPSVDVVIYRHDARPKIIIGHLQRLDIAEYVVQEINAFLGIELSDSQDETTE